VLAGSSILLRMPTRDSQILADAYQRLHTSGPEFGGDEEGNHGLTNHGPMAVEVMVRRSLDLDVHRWLDRYVRRLTDLPAQTEAITESTWPQALGAGRRRVGDWTAFFNRQLAEHPWQTVLTAWWPRLLPGIAAGSTHGVIRVSHAVRALLADEATTPAIVELAHGLAFWSARYHPLPDVRSPAGLLSAAAAFDAVPRLPDQTGVIADRLTRLGRLPGWSDAVGALSAPAAPDDVPAALAELTHAATVGYLRHGPASPVLLVHTATAPNAVLHTLPALPPELWRESFGYAWSAAAAIIATYAAPTPPPASGQTTSIGTDPVADVLDRAARHGDEHVLKFTDTAVEVFERTQDPDAIAAAHRVRELIDTA
jgi:hypothetical protein